VGRAGRRRAGPWTKGGTNPTESPSGTIRGDLGLYLGLNVIHGSGHEAPGSNEHETEVFFDDAELLEYERIDESWLYE
jgi:nucleoside-diphosphate kinase